MIEKYEEYNILKHFDVDIYDPYHIYTPTHYVYMIEFVDSPGCYKIGSSKNIIGRLDTLAKEYGSAKIILFGHSTDGVLSERKIQRVLFRYSNRFVAYCGCDKNQKCVGPTRSREHCVLDTIGILMAMDAFHKHCKNVKSPVYPDAIYRGHYK
jgi:hypothetical protein